MSARDGAAVRVEDVVVEFEAPDESECGSDVAADLKLTRLNQNARYLVSQA